MKSNKIVRGALNTLLPIIGALLIGAVIILSIGQNPMTTYGVMIQKSLFSVKGLLKTLHFASPLILTGLGIAITFKANIFNMGVEGQMLLGAFFAGVVGFTVDAPSYILIPLCLLTGMAVGMLFALIPALLKAFFNVNEMVVTLMLNYAVIEVVKYLSTSVFRDPTAGYVATYPISKNAVFNKIGGYDITFFFVISIAAFLVLYIIMKKSKLGYEITAIGKNPEFAEASGMRVAKKIIIIMLISGAVSGLAGAGFLMSEKQRFTLDFSGSPGLGWDGMLIALLGAHSPVGVLVAAIFYAALKTGSEYIGLYTNVPTEIVGIIQGILILMLSVKFINEQTHFFSKIKQRFAHSKKDAVAAVKGDA